MRRIEPELISFPQFDQSPALFWIRGQLVPVEVEQMPERYRQLQSSMQQRMEFDPGLRKASRYRQEAAMGKSLFPADAAYTGPTV